MVEFNYKPQYFDSKITELVRKGNKTIFVFENEVGEIKEIKVDESIERIKSRMEDVKNGERDMVYLTNCMMNIDISLLSNGKWQLFDEFDIYEFSI
jgi:P2-related tail formation protein